MPVLLAVLGQSLISAGTHLAAKYLTSEMAAPVLVVTRLVLASAAYVAVLAALPGKRWPERRLWPWLLGFGFVAGPLNQGLFLLGVARSSATHASLLYALTPLGVYALNVALKREAAKVSRIIGILIALTGVVVLLVGRTVSGALSPLLGDLLILGAVIAWVVWTVESAPFAREHGGLRAAGWSVIAGGLWLVPAVPFVVTPAALSGVTWKGWACLAYLVLLTSLLSYALWNYALSRAETSRVAVFANVQPVVTTLAAWLVLGEVPGIELLVGGVAVLIGVRVATQR